MCIQCVYTFICRHVDKMLKQIGTCPFINAMYTQIGFRHLIFSDHELLFIFLFYLEAVMNDSPPRLFAPEHLKFVGKVGSVSTRNLPNSDISNKSLCMFDRFIELSCEEKIVIFSGI